MTDRIRVPLSQPWIDDLVRERDELHAKVERLRHAASGLSGELEELRSLVLDWHQAVTPGERIDAMQALSTVAEALGRHKEG